jgi:hypothetical protein
MCQPHAHRAVHGRGAGKEESASHHTSADDLAGAQPLASSRRAFLGGAGLAGVGALAFPAIDLRPARAGSPARPDSRGAARGLAASSTLSGDWHPDQENLRFTLAVMPDTQYMFDASTSVQPAPVGASFQYLLDQNSAENIVFLAQLGDITQNNGLAGEFPAAGATFAGLDQKGVAYSVLAATTTSSPPPTTSAEIRLTWRRSGRNGSPARRRSAAPAPMATTRTTSSMPRDVNGCCWRWTGVLRPAASIGRTR